MTGKAQAARRGGHVGRAAIVRTPGLAGRHLTPRQTGFFHSLRKFGGV